MSKKEKARPTGSAAEQAKQGNHRTSGNPYEKYTPRGGGSQFEIADLLGHGPGNGLRLSDLVRLTGWPGRDVRGPHSERQCKRLFSAGDGSRPRRLCAVPARKGARDPERGGRHREGGGWSKWQMP